MRRSELLRRGSAFALVLAGVAACAEPAPRNPYPQPPPLRSESVPRHPGGRVVWQPGHWHWNGRGYDWVPGRYVEQRGRWVPGHWAHQGRAGWVWVAGHWQ